MIEKDNLTKYLLFLEDVFPYMEKYQYKKGMKEIILEMKQLLKDNENSAVTDCFIEAVKNLVSLESESF